MRPLLSLSAVALVVAAAWWWLAAGDPAPGPADRPPTTADAPPAPDAAGTGTAEAVGDITSGAGPASSPVATLGGPAAVPVAPDTEVLPAPPTEAVVAESVTAASWAIRHSAADWRAEDYLRIARRKAALDPETLMVAYEYLRSCFGRPTGEAELERMRTAIEARHGDERSPRRASLPELLDQLDRGYERCGGLEGIDLSAEAYETLELASDLGYVPAQVAFLDDGWGLLLQDDRWLYRNPAYAARYRDRALTYGDFVVASRTPEGVIAWARFLGTGIVAPPDRVAGWAWLEVARRFGVGAERSQIDALQRDYETWLSPEELSEAASLADSLCDVWCGPP